MYILQKTYNEETTAKGDDRIAVFILPSAPQSDMTRFEQIIKDMKKEINKESGRSKWTFKILNAKAGNRTPSDNYSLIYNANVVIADCSEKKPNVFYMIGLAHALGRPVCSCYLIKSGKNLDIPFNVHGRQNLTYSLATVEKQKEFKDKLMEWVRQHE